MSKSIDDSVHSIEYHVGANSHLFQQLAECGTSYGWLKGKLETVEPTLNNLSTSVGVILDSGSNLARRFEDFGKKLEEVPIFKGIQDSERRLTELFAENTQLQLRLQKLSSEIDSVKQLDSEKDAKTEGLRQSLIEARQKYIAAEDRIRGLEMEKTAMKGEMELRDQRTRHELATVNANSQAQMRAQYERRLQTLQAEKDELEKAAELATTQLSGVQDALVGFPAARILRTSLTVSRLRQSDYLTIRKKSASYWYVICPIMERLADGLGPRDGATDSAAHPVLLRAPGSNQRSDSRDSEVPRSRSYFLPRKEWRSRATQTGPGKNPRPRADINSPSHRRRRPSSARGQHCSLFIS